MAALLAVAACGGKTGQEVASDGGPADSGNIEAGGSMDDTGTSAESGSDASAEAGGCEEVDNGGLLVPQCTCSWMITNLSGAAASTSPVTVNRVTTTVSQDIDPSWDLGLPAGVPVCLVDITGSFDIPGPPGGADVTGTLGFKIYRDQPWTLLEFGCCGPDGGP
jgi:hypothetical protein